MQLAVGFDGRGAWISAQDGALAIRKHTALCPLETRIHLACEADDLVVVVSSGSLIVTRGVRTLHIDRDDAAAATRALLSGSLAVRRARAATNAFGQSQDPGTPESSVHAALMFVRSLAAEHSTTAIAQSRATFIEAESIWMDSLAGVGPTGGRVVSRRTSPITCRPPLLPAIRDISDWIARFAQMDREQEMAQAHGWAGSVPARGVA